MSSPAKRNGAATVWDAASKSGIQTWPSELVKKPEFAREMRLQEVDLLLNAYSLSIINREILAAPRIGSFNLHPGPLPRYAGLNVVLWAIYRGEKSYGVTVHRMVPEVDAGPIAYQEIMEIADGETGLSLSTRCTASGINLLSRLVETAATNPGGIPEIPQDLNQREFFGKAVPQGGRLDWDAPAAEVVNFVRACDFYPLSSPWGHPRTMLNARDIQVARASLTGIPSNLPAGTVGESSESGVLVACKDQWITLKMINVDGKYSNAAATLKRGDRLHTGGT
jgi:UDP-4-amino-4-deoxy-L-arabinose formyltransferase/UDP-glucuronic acid dehydrogenase (UDP-4-keto-hexauronic acid decarboxylating)